MREHVEADTKKPGNMLIDDQSARVDKLERLRLTAWQDVILQREINVSLVQLGKALSRLEISV